MGTQKTATERDIIEIDEALCNGCGECIASCAEGALELVDGKARLASDIYCDGLGACLGQCPQGALKIARRASLEFDGGKARLKAAEGIGRRPAGCSGAAAMSLRPHVDEKATGDAHPPGPDGPALANWPIQLRLVPPSAPFLNSRTLTVAADCTAFASPRFHQEFLGAGSPLVMGCPKLDDMDLCITKLREILEARPEITELKVPIMEVPCCRGLIYAAATAIRQSGRAGEVTPRLFVVGRDGAMTEEAPGQDALPG
jgi:NAD-dependent dihydropyrimidine dehydrogenase PreA subunit